MALQLRIQFVFKMGILQGSILVHRINELMPKTFQEGQKHKDVNSRFSGITAFQTMLKWSRKLYLSIEELGTFLRN